MLSQELNEIVKDNYDRGRNNFTVSRYITLATKADNFISGRKKLEDLAGDFDNELREINARFTDLSGIERLKVMNQMLRLGKPLYGGFNEIERSNLTVKDLISPGQLEFNHNKINFSIDDKEGKIVYLRDYPTNLKDTLFKDLIESDVDMVLTVHGNPYSIADTTTRLNNQATKIEGEVIRREQKAVQRNFSTRHIARTAKKDEQEINEQIEFVNETGYKQFFSLIMIYLWADTKAELNDNLDKITQAAC